MTTTKKQSVSREIITVLIGGLLMGMLWRARGEHGWGSESGVLMVGLVYALFVTTVLGERKKLDFGWFAFTVTSFVITTPAWGTLLDQITGILHASSKTDDVVLTADISMFSGIFMMLCLGFGLASVFGIMLGRGYSGKQWRLRDFIVMFAVFYAVDLLTKASVSHWMIELIQPEAADLFEQGLEKAGIEGSAYSVYMQHFGSIPWSKKIHGGRNYFSEVQCISTTFRAIAALITVRFVVKDKVAAKIGTVVCAAFAVSITVADLFFFFTNGGLRNTWNTYSGTFIYAWSNWEYFTGFIAGIIITAFLIKLKPCENITEPAFSAVPDKLRKALVFIGGYGIIAVNIVRPAILRFDTTPATTAIGTVLGVIIAVVTIALLIKYAGINTEKIGMYKLSHILFVFFVSFIALFYLFFATAEYRDIESIGTLHNILFTVSAAACLAWGINKTVRVLK